MFRVRVPVEVTNKLIIGQVALMMKSLIPASVVTHNQSRPLGNLKLGSQLFACLDGCIHIYANICFRKQLINVFA